MTFEVTRDLPFYDAITEDLLSHASRFPREMRVLEGEVRLGELVSTRLAPLVARADHDNLVTPAPLPGD